MNLERSEIGLSVKDLQAELDFFHNLGFRDCENQADNPSPHRILTDGWLILGIYQLEFDAPVVGVYCDDIKKDVSDLRQQGLDVQEFPTSDGNSLEAAIAVSPAKIPLFLQPAEVFTHPERAENPSSRIGVFGELAVPVDDFDEEAEFWTNAGFEFLGGPYTEPERWGIVGSWNLPIGIHETKQYKDHALTFFAPNMGDTLARLGTEGVTFEWELKDEQGRYVHTATKTPNGYTLFLFTGDLEKM